MMEIVGQPDLHHSSSLTGALAGRRPHRTILVTTFWEKTKKRGPKAMVLKK